MSREHCRALVELFLACTVRCGISAPWHWGGSRGPLGGIRKPHDKWFTADSRLKMEIVDKQWNIVSLLTKMTVPVCPTPAFPFHRTVCAR